MSLSKSAFVRWIKTWWTVVVISIILFNLLLWDILVLFYVDNQQHNANEKTVESPFRIVSKPLSNEQRHRTENKTTEHHRQKRSLSNVTLKVKNVTRKNWYKRKKFFVDENGINNLFVNLGTAKDVSCPALFDNRKEVIHAATAKMMHPRRKAMSNAMYKAMTADCYSFRKVRGYFDTPVTEEEDKFPLAYSILGYKQIEAIERLLRVIYRPQNYYCIHMDVKTSRDDLRTITDIANCFDNVFLSSVSLDVRWGQFAVLESELICMRDVWKYPHWKYFINLTGQEFPLKTNWEIVRILKAMKWANLVDGTWIRAKTNYFYRWTKAKSTPPHNIRPIKGSVHIAVNRDFVDFVLHDYRSKAFLRWLNKTEIPDESFFSSLNHNPHLGIPGSFLGEPEEYPKKPTFTRYKNWELGHGTWVRKCGGSYIRNICILGVEDLHRMKDDIGLFVNKVYLSEQYFVYDCLEELIFNRTKEQYLGRQSVDTSFYESLDWVKLRLVL